MDWIAVIGYILTPVASVVTWFVSRKKQNNDFLKDLQDSINMLSAENKKLYQELSELRRGLYEKDKEIIELKAQISKK